MKEEKRNELNHEFCAKFRTDLKTRGLQYVIVELLTSNSDKVGLKKLYLIRECKKSGFAAKVEDAMTSVGENNRSLRPALKALRSEIIGE